MDKIRRTYISLRKKIHTSVTYTTSMYNTSFFLYNLYKMSKRRDGKMSIDEETINKETAVIMLE